ncbi:MAG: hypothetical protein Q8N88_05290, partial [Nanoarchaeota archaeon]|nr:hypothetical protein [Nanoarchaeota archaeon]
MSGDFKILFLSVLIFLLTAFFVSAEFNGCWDSGASENICEASEECIWRTSAEDPFCMNANGCCMNKACWLYDGTNSTACTENDGMMSCMWDPFFKKWYPNGTQGASGGCYMDWETNDQEWGGVETGCWSHDGDRGSCNAQQGSCKWTANDQNQDPWCPIKNLADAKNKNPSASTTDIGCCQNVGCWNYDNSETECVSVLQGNCFYTNNSYGGGWCNVKSCQEITTQANCTYAKQTLMMPCNWNNNSQLCEGMSGGGFEFYEDKDSCFSAGGWYNSTGGCVMPTGNFGGGSGGFMFVEEPHCWFADDKPLICGNVSGCAYCVAGSGPNGILNSSSNICFGKEINICEGHDVSDNGDYANANNSANLGCGDIRIKSACNYGPLPNCKWGNSSAVIGAYCEVGAKSEKKSAPPAQYCEDPVAKDNYSICMQLANDFMMPCKWQNTTYPIKNCTFNNNAIFGSSGGEMDFGIINSQFSCTSAGGTWNTEYYVDGDVLKQDSWCEMSGFFNIDQGKGMGNKGNCDTSCWACEFQNNGTAWSNVASAEQSCENSVAVGGFTGGCVWRNDSNAFNKLGWCDFPKEMENGGAKDCNSECEGCNFMGDAQVACEGSMANNGAGCKWVNDTNNAKGGFCVDKTKKTCDSDCFSCVDVTSCQNNNINCTWGASFNLCSPQGFSGEVCFDAIDNDADGMIDCSDPDCGFDNFCGGSAFGGDCFAKSTEESCEITPAFSGLNCTWINDTWNPTGWCDMPGANCWKFDSDL